MNSKSYPLVLDPSCGKGEFLLESAKKLSANGCPDVLTRLWAADFSQLNLLLTKKRLENWAKNNNQKVLDFANMIKYSSVEDLAEKVKDMKFDIIVGNPPYKDLAKNGRQTNRSIWKNFLLESAERLNNGGYLAMITPTGWCAPSDNGKLIEKLFAKKNLVYANINHDLKKKYFPKVSTTIGYTIVENSTYKHQTIIETNNGKTEVVDLSKTRLIVASGLSIIKKITEKSGPRCCFKLAGKSQQYSGQGFHNNQKPAEATYKNIHHVNSSKDYIDHEKIPVRWSIEPSSIASKKKVVIPYNGPANIILDSGNMGVGWCQVLILPDDTNMENVKSIFHSRLFKFFVKQKHTQYNETKNLNQFPFLDLTKKWKEKEIYGYFNLTK